MKESVALKVLTSEDCSPELLGGFNRYQEVTRCWRKQDGEWRLLDIAFVEQWDDEKKQAVTQELLGCMRKGGVAIGAFSEGRMIGFADVDSAPFGTNGEYLNMPMLHVSNETRNRGVGKALFREACHAASGLGASKLYISAHSSEESQAFYRAVGCVEAAEINPVLFAAEPVDCHLEYRL